jgi:catechol 2,3-dioxygenase-like lactoylglutathione lyase family enzyme
MLNNAKLVAFAATARPDEARRFYVEVLGLALTEEHPFALVFDANGTMLRLQKLEHWAPPGHTALGWQVDDIRGTIHKLAARGVHFERFGGLPQDDLGVWTTPDGTAIAWFKDPDGNTLSLTQF